jgi:hypothetical protein
MNERTRFMTLKRAFAVCLLLGIAVSPAAAQDIAGGLKGGLYVSTIPDFATAVGETGLDTSSRAVLAIGGFVALPVATQLDIQPELFYTQKGLRFVGSEAFEGDNTVKLAYIELPVLVVYRFAADRTRTGYVLAGPAFAFNTSAKVDGDAGEVDVDDDVRGTEVSLIFGGGYSFGRLLAEARWTEGLTALNEQNQFVLEQDVRNRAFTILFGVRF